VATLGLAQIELFRRVGSYDQARARKDAAERPDDVGAQLKVADIDVATGRIDEAFDRLLGLVRRTSGEDRDRARVHLVSLFDLFPRRTPGWLGPAPGPAACCSDQPLGAALPGSPARAGRRPARRAGRPGACAGCRPGSR
jgi:hypothetical protein